MRKIRHVWALASKSWSCKLIWVRSSARLMTVSMIWARKLNDSSASCKHSRQVAWRVRWAIGSNLTRKTVKSHNWNCNLNPPCKNIKKPKFHCSNPNKATNSTSTKTNNSKPKSLASNNNSNENNKKQSTTKIKTLNCKSNLTSAPNSCNKYQIRLLSS